MPCGDGGGPCTSVDYCSDRLDSVTQMLCWLCGELTYNGQLDYISENQKLAKWWYDHKLSDNNRVKSQMESEVAEYPSAAVMAKSFIHEAEKVHCVSNFHKEWFTNLATEVWLKYQTKKSKKEKALSKLTNEERKLLGI